MRFDGEGFLEKVPKINLSSEFIKCESDEVVVSVLQ